MRSGAVRLVAILGLVGLLVTSVALSGHHHAEAAASNGCAACLVAHHAPAAAPVQVTLNLFAPASFPIAPDLVVAPATCPRSTQLGRAPPAALFSSAV